MPAAETPCSGSYVDDEATNHFTADCSSATAHDDTCVLVHSAGYGGGAGTCDTSDGSYSTAVAVATPCDGTFVDDEATNHLTASCTGVTTHGAACVLTVSAGYAGGAPSRSAAPPGPCVAAARPGGPGR